ncbi:p-hydroxylaminobenzoate lyase [Mycena pura]|uniref:p-hydroxylaminobenzoate lyase n=1 Tax=Mycena pura TaxID=153505 RepID=A0AAD6YK50_9AGAR|nr:p-hydroxylaminobenzoate lyase [Mycena pura]
MESNTNIVDKASVLDASQYPNALKPIAWCCQFFQDLPGEQSEPQLWAGTPYYEDFAALIRAGIAEGWVAQTEIDGRSSAATRFFSITTVYMDGNASPGAEDDVLRGQYWHAHPYGEITCVITLDKAELRGMHGWQGAGWTSPAAGTHHFPETRGGALVALFFLPAGRISYNARPEMPQPVMT